MDFAPTTTILLAGERQPIPGSEDPQASGRRRGSSRALGRFGSESPRLLQIGLPRKEQPALFSTPYFLLVGVYINRVQKLAYLVFRQ